MRTFIDSDAFYPSLIVLVFFTFIFFKKKSLKIKIPILIIIIPFCIFIEKKILLLTENTKHVFFDTSLVSLGFTILYFSLLLNIAYSYINRFFNNRKGEKTELIIRLLKITTFVFLLMCFGEKFYLSASGIITFGSVSGIVIGIASKAVLSNFVSGIMLYFDRPFNIGDYVYSPQDKLSGTVSKIGLRITTIINDDHKPVYIPNSLFSTLIMVNASRAINKRILLNFIIPVNEHDKINDFIEQTKTIMAKNQSISDGTGTCYIDDISQTMLTITLSCFVDKENYSNYNKIKDDIILEVASLMDNLALTPLIKENN